MLLKSNAKEMTIEIFQSENPLCFVVEVPLNSYRKAYDSSMYVTGSETDDEILEFLFHEFNVNHPSDFKGRSMSVGDIVVIDKKRCYRCAMQGWKLLEELK